MAKKKRTLKDLFGDDFDDVCADTPNSPEVLAICDALKHKGIEEAVRLNTAYGNGESVAAQPVEVRTVEPASKKMAAG